MPAPNSRPLSPPYDEYSSIVPGIAGRVPNCPKANRRRVDRGVRFYDSYRPSYSPGADHAISPRTPSLSPGDHVKDIYVKAEESHTCNYAASGGVPPGVNDQEEVLAEGFARRQRDLANAAAQRAVDGKYPTRGRSQVTNSLHFGDKDTSRIWGPDANGAAGVPGPRIKREYSTGLEEGEIPRYHEESSLFVSQYDAVPMMDIVPERRAAVNPNTSTPTPRPATPIPKEVPKPCVCAIDHDCPHKHHTLSDCRTLVQENPEWEKKKKEFQENYHSELSLNDNPQEETFVGLQEAHTFRKRLATVIQRTHQSKLLHDDFQNLAGSVRMFQYNSVTKDTLVESRLLDRLKIFLSTSNRPRLATLQLPNELIEDLTILLTKWQAEDFSVRARRGCRYNPKTNQWSIEPDCQFRRKSDYYGHGHLVNGQVWLYRIDMVRDGAHGATRAGIAGTIDNGATSIVVSSKKSRNNEYADVDRREYVEYMSTALNREEDDREATNIKDKDEHRADRVTRNSKGQELTDDTKKLITSYRTGKPVRVFRGFRLRKIVPLRPKVGFRYDGLYVVTNYELLNQDRQIYKFYLERLKDGQGPIRNVSAPIHDDDKGRPSRKRKRDRAE
ncbi:hypothetical protein G647_04606 [Cladophialophora carrionii CBS 160.54]|uniref:YDG domain-containing protein n=1 Tax=Cladophialophora carrionii CBS 160.54 TaxID=1279043 RepID=V9DFX8_9EURO|nr:uncharacterized protein G647_04606 [Cladophialophora carrionii CBS 160.54]ETI25233.1 hypothetical protein G647_04606 [Cladophialophora carrionii CBS 160.54]